MIQKYVNKQEQLDVFKTVFGDLNKAKLELASSARMLYEQRALNYGLNGIPTSDGVCLDLGCGNGILTRLLVSRFSRVIASDFAMPALYTTRKIVTGKNVDYISSDALSLPFDSQVFDFVVLKDFIHHLTDPVHVLKEVHRVSKTSGYLLSVEPNNRNLVARMIGCLLKHERQYVANSPQYLIDLIRRSGYRLISIHFDGFYVPYGPFLRFPDSLVSYLPRFEDLMKTFFPAGGGHFIACYQKIRINRGVRT